MASLKTILYIISAAITLMILLFIVLYYLNTSPRGVTSTNKEVTIAGGDKAGEIILFFATWCPACKSIKPEWEQFKTDYSNKKINDVVLLIHEVDCSEPDPGTEDIMNQYNITGFPTVKLICNGKITELQQKPTYDNLVKFVKSTL
jgi:thiol-disulfide isomerase/thioredoxin